MELSPRLTSYPVAINYSFKRYHPIPAPAPPKIASFNRVPNCTAVPRTPGRFDCLLQEFCPHIRNFFFFFPPCKILAFFLQVRKILHLWEGTVSPSRPDSESNTQLLTRSKAVMKLKQASDIPLQQAQIKNKWYRLKKAKNLGVTTSTPKFFLNLKKVSSRQGHQREREKN